jgi:hypothetical protein
LCDKTLSQLRHAAELVEGIRANDAASMNAAAWLRARTRFIPYEGQAIVIPVEAIFEEIEESEADEVFGERDGAA